MRNKLVVRADGTKVLESLSVQEETRRDQDEARWQAAASGRAARIEEQRREGVLLNQARLIRIVEVLVDEIEAMRRGDPPTAGIAQLRGFLNNL